MPRVETETVQETPTLTIATMTTTKVSDLLFDCSFSLLTAGGANNALLLIANVADGKNGNRASDTNPDNGNDDNNQSKRL